MIGHFSYGSRTMLDARNCICFIKSLGNPMIALVLSRPVYLICLYLVLQHLFPSFPVMIRLQACLEVWACVCHIG